MDNQLKCIKCTVTGKVQGVWFRANTKNKANEFGITGWVRNLSTGQVETQACGTKAQLEKFVAWLHQGPSGAKVNAVEVQIVPCEKFSTFEIHYSHN